MSGFLPLIRVQNAAARVVTMSRKHDHITPILYNLHWLPIPQRIQYKLLLLVYKSLQGLAPAYLSELVSWYTPVRNLRSVNDYLAVEQSVKKSKTNGRKSKVLYKDRAFQHLGPKLFNQLPIHIRASQSLNVFKSRLKTHLFQSAYNTI